MVRRCTTLLIALVSSLGAPSFSQVKPTQVLMHIDNTHSSIQFSVPFMGVTTVNGNFERFCGTMFYDPNQMANTRIELFVDASSVNTSLKIRDRDLRNMYLHVASYPVIHFLSNRVVSIDKKNFEVTGRLTLHGKTEDATFRMTLIGEIGSTEVGFQILPVKLNRNTFGVMENSMGANSVGDTVTVIGSVRLRDLTSYREAFDQKYPVATPKTVTPLKGVYRSDNGATVLFIQHDKHQFMTFTSDDWAWMSELVPTGGQSWKTASFNKRIELKGNEIVVLDDSERVIFRKQQ